jgi:tight adherence protein C
MTLLLVAFFGFVLLAVAGSAILYERWASDVPGGTQETSSFGTDLLVSLGKAVGSFQKDDGLRSLLFRAGYRSPSSVAMFHGLQLAAGITLALVCDWIVLLQGSGAGSLLIPAFCGLGFGYLIPKRFLEWQVKSRAHRLRSALPPALDLIVLALEAGQTIDHGIIEAARSIGRVYPDLSSELTFCSLEMRAGTPRGEALRRMGERCGEEEIRKLVTVLVDGERFGSSLGPALRSHAHYLRTRMRHRAQEASRKLTVKLVMPVFFLIFPSVLLVTLGPAYLQLQQFLGTLLKP